MSSVPGVLKTENKFEKPGRNNGGRVSDAQLPNASADETPKDDLLARVTMISERAKENYKAAATSMSSLLMGIDDNAAAAAAAAAAANDDDDDDDDNYAPSSPRYSDLSFRHLIKRPAYVPNRDNKLLVIVLVSVTFSVQMFSRDIWIPFFEPALLAFPAWSQTSLALFPFWNAVMGVLLVIPTCVVINKYGIKTGLLCSCAASTFGTAIRCLPFIRDSTFLIHVSAVFLSSASVVAVPLTVTISTCCFRIGEKNFVTGCLTSSSLIGSAAGLLVTIVLRAQPPPSPPKHPSSSNAAHWKTVVTNTMYTCFAMNAACLLLVYGSFPQERNDSTSERRVRTSRKFVPTKSFVLQSISNNAGLVCLALSYVCSNAYSWPWYQMIDVTYFSMGFLLRTGEDCRFWMIVHTCALTLSVCWFADRLAGSNKCYGLVCHFVGSAFMLLVMWTVTSRQNPTYLVTGVMLAFPLPWAAQSLLYQMVADSAYPLPENLAVGLVHVLEMIFENFVYTVMAVFPEHHLYWMHWFTFGAAFLGFVFLLMFNDDIHVNRSKILKY